MPLNYLDRLNFSLPDFTRVIWVNDELRKVWEPRLQRIALAWSEVEWKSVLAQVRRCALIQISREKFINKAPIWAENCLRAIPLAIEGMGSYSYSNIPQPSIPGHPIVYRTVIGSNEAVVDFHKAWTANDDDMIGALLGYPRCCRQFFKSEWVEGGSVDTTWAMACNTVHFNVSKNSRPHIIELEGCISANILWRWMGVRAVPHLPCSFDCKESDAMGRALLTVGRQEGYTTEMDWIEEILSWPVEWSALHGIAEVRTPILKVLTRSNAGQKYIVRKLGTEYPEHGALGLMFPYVAIEKRKSLHPQWHYRDNGFASEDDMNSCHESLVKFARQILRNVKGDILDLGCGNGILLQKICKDLALQPFGVDINSESIQHAKELWPGFAENFVTADMFNIRSWPGNGDYELIILMIGRLLEVRKENAKNFLEELEHRCKGLLIYLYPDWSNLGLTELARKTDIPIDNAEIQCTTSGVQVAYIPLG